MRPLIIALTMLATGSLATAGPAHAVGSRCAAVAPRLTAASRAADARLVEKADPGQDVPPAGVTYILADRHWRIIWALPNNAERGVYFFRTKRAGGFRLVNTWGGILEPDARADAIAFARSLKGGGPPPLLAGCFADALLAGK